VDGGLSEPLLAMPYALATRGARVFAGLANGEIWTSEDRSETWHALELGGDRVEQLVALAVAG
jgi:hypothetical protein